MISTELNFVRFAFVLCFGRLWKPLWRNEIFISYTQCTDVSWVVGHYFGVLLLVGPLLIFLKHLFPLVGVEGGRTRLLDQRPWTRHWWLPLDYLVINRELLLYLKLLLFKALVFSTWENSWVDYSRESSFVGIDGSHVIIWLNWDQFILKLKSLSLLLFH